MKKIMLNIVLLLGFTYAQELRMSSGYSLFSDFKASKIGDAVTIIVVESSQASNRANTTTGKSSDLGLDVNGKMGAADMLPKMDFDIGSRNNFNGGGSTQSQGMVKAKISAMVDSVYANGNLRIVGTRKILVNDEEQIITIKGLVRSIDIKSDNSVFSYNISNAEILFQGNGKIDDSQSPGWLTKILHWIF